MLEGYTRLELLVIALVLVLFFIGCAILFTYDPKRFPKIIAKKPAKKKTQTAKKTTAKTAQRGKGLVNTQPRMAPSDEQLIREFREFKASKRQKSERAWFN